MNASVSSSVLKLVKVGNSTGVILPKEMLGRLGLTAGDSVAASVDQDSLTLRRSDEEFETQMALAREIMTRRRRALRELAK